MRAEGRRIEVRGTVQGVGFRPWVYRLALEEGIRGRVRNDTAGVCITAFGESSSLDAFLARLEADPPPRAAVREMRWHPIPPEADESFSIEESEEGGRRLVSIPPDLATCEACLAEVFDPADRRYRYPFTNCTHCGPRFTIAQGVPYDRSRTTMAAFPMCPACRAEYEDPLDRRFHAQPNACPDCGPRLRLLSMSGERLAAGDPLAEAAGALREGWIVAVKGLGGYHLACDATCAPVVRWLRRRKGRDRKPFAVMVEDVRAAEALVEASDLERALLASVERPIVLLERRRGNGIAEEVAPGSRLLGVMLAYTPLHHLLLRETGRPLVMTSANLSEEPIVHDEEEAVARLAGIADLLLSHDRDIETRCDDSVSRVVAGRPVLLRRSRGWVPGPVALASPLARPVLGCGAQLKNTFCLAEGGHAWLGPHVGDLDNLEAWGAYQEALAKMETFLGIRPEVVAHDLHPDYLSTRYAQGREDAVRIAVQHHHAHVASAMAEHGLEGPVLGLAWDGTGYGTDGASWGGELLLADYARYERLATFRPIRLPGGDAAVREPWRAALALLEDAFEGEPPLERLELFEGIAPAEIAFVRRMLARDLRCPQAHGVGRLFDALGALGLGMAKAHFEGEVALAWNQAADPAVHGAYPLRIEEHSGLARLDPRPLVRAVVDDLVDGRPRGEIAARFHNALAEGALALVARATRKHGRHPVVLTGGCFQNDLLAERVVKILGGSHEVFLQEEVPPGDGGIALGQVLVADAVLRSGGGGS